MFEIEQCLLKKKAMRILILTNYFILLVNILAIIQVHVTCPFE